MALVGLFKHGLGGKVEILRPAHGHIFLDISGLAGAAPVIFSAHFQLVAFSIDLST